MAVVSHMLVHLQGLLTGSMTREHIGINPSHIAAASGLQVLQD